MVQVKTLPIRVVGAKESTGIETWLKETGYKYLRPIQMAYESSRFMLPIGSA